jgi:hypothetical protein
MGRSFTWGRFRLPTVQASLAGCLLGQISTAGSALRLPSNTAMVEPSASASAHLQQDAAHLVGAVSSFKT